MGKIIGGRYDIIEHLREGGFGITFLAKDLLRPGQPRCVVKQLRPEQQFSKNAWKAVRRWFNREAETLERLGRHDQIPLLLAHLEENGNFYIVQDFIEGRTLRDELRDVKRLSEEEVITLLRQGLTVLSYVHEQGVIHRDIKPENLIRRQDGVLCLIDFGIVKAFSAQNLTESTTTVAVGTPGYTPYEQTCGKPYPASDVYALGLVAIEALTGKLPTALVAASDTAELVWQTGLHINPALAQVLTTMVRHHHSHRYANGQATLQALEEALVPAVPTVVNPPEPAPPELDLSALEKKHPSDAGHLSELDLSALEKGHQRPPSDADPPIALRTQEHSGSGWLMKLALGVGILILGGAGWAWFGRGLRLPMLSLPTADTSPQTEEDREATTEDPIVVTANLSDKSWMSVRADGKTIYEGTPDKGYEETWTAETSLVFITGNAGSVSLAVNGDDPVVLGDSGAVRTVRITPDSNAAELGTP